MKKLLHTFALLFTSVLLISCTSTAIESSNNGKACNTGKVKLSSDFATGRMDNCLVTGKNEYLITLIPENTPINSSPWYAFKIIAEQPTAIKITMKVQGDKHRYPPKVSRDGKRWRLHEYKLRGDRLTMTVNATDKPTYIAAQEIIDNQYYVNWANKLEQQNKIIFNELGQSTQGRPVYKLESKGDSKEWIVILGRLHPPEVTGALALFPFAERLLSASELAKKFRKNYNLLIIPNVNPDGVDMGNWRHNANGLDLNRDWINFSQKETKQIHNYLQKLVEEGNKIKFAIDFHSTHDDVFYTMPVDYGVEEKYFVKHWLDSLDQLMPDFTVVTKPGNTPNNGVSKQYFSDNYKIHAITYEMGDNTDRHKINNIAFNAASTLMKTLLSNQNHNRK